MYRQVWINADQRNLQKILWRFSPKADILVYNLNTVTYGTASAAFLAIRSLHEIGHRHLNDNPKIASIILHDFYVDDLLTGCDTIEEILDIKRSLSTLLSTYGFPLRKWISNTNLVDQNSNFDTLQIGGQEQNKTLGLLWNSSSDTLRYSISHPPLHTNKITKRHILSCTAQIFDPLGLLSPVTITAKIILQELWKLKISWDESVPTDLHTTWSTYRAELSRINNLNIPRQVICHDPVYVQLHGFCDAAQTAYGACIYIRCHDKLGNLTSNLFCAKTRVAPLKVITIPRLELCAALLLAELINKVMLSLKLNFQNVTLWCDSTIVLSWVHTSPHLLKTFVANRISRIQDLTDKKSWKYINTSENPADLLTRGISPENLMNSELWFNGPSWLRKSERDWPVSQRESPVFTPDISELRSNTLTFATTFNDVDLISRFSSLTRLVRVFSYIRRFINNVSKNRTSKLIGYLSTKELNTSLLMLIKIVQLTSFPEDFERLSNSKGLSKKSKILSLNPFFDAVANIKRVRGRIQNSQFNYAKKHPAILPGKHHLTTLIARHQHIKLLHAGPQAVLASLREEFWPLSGRNLARRIVRECTRCFRFSGKPQRYLMGNLPETRLTPSRPFTVSGIDYAGPFLLRDRRGRNFKTTKAYIALFVCFASKAVHLEIVGDLTTDSFLAALRRFMARRGKCAQIFSDNGTTFVGANNEIKQFFETHSGKIHDHMTNDGIEWHFIPPRSPHFGGIWESGIKSVKYHLKRVMGNASLIYEDLSTLLCQIEACLNSRPLYPLSQDPNDPNPLTPAHLLIGEPLTTVPEHDLLHIKENRLSRFQRHQQLLQHFWSRWTKEYVSNLQQRVKWKENCSQLSNPGVLVLVKEDGIPPLKWQLGRILQTHPGKDGIVRSVTLKTLSGEIKRAVAKICVLPNQN